jgi:hypothetical protein
VCQLTNVARHCRPLLQKNLGRGSPLNVSYKNCCQKTYVNDLGDDLHVNKQTNICIANHTRLLWQNN